MSWQHLDPPHLLEKVCIYLFFLLPYLIAYRAITLKVHTPCQIQPSAKVSTEPSPWKDLTGGLAWCSQQIIDRSVYYIPDTPPDTVGPQFAVHNVLYCMPITAAPPTALRLVALAAAAPPVALPAGPPAAQHFMLSRLLGVWWINM